ncbi:MAG: hypothetical protein ACRC7G_12735 [Beijerinckiaceae bacterium]
MTARHLVFASVVALFALSGALWWRFGEAIYAERLLGAIMACF